MTPQDKGWLKSYLEFRKDLFRDLTAENARKASHPEQSLYKILQPTGLMYGTVTGQVGEQEGWTAKERMKVILAESLISSSLLFHEKPVGSNEELSDVILKTVQKIGNFYNDIFPELSTPAKTFFGKKRSPIEVAEKILDKRIDRTFSQQDSFWSSFFHNSLLFLDVYIFGQWIHTGSDKIVADFFRYERDELRFSVVKVMSAAAHANKEIVPQETKLFQFFLQSTQLPADKKKEAIKIFEEGIAIEDIDLPSENSWLLKKYFIEIAILTLWADKKVEQSEIDFLRHFCRRFRFSEEEFENSVMAIEGFVLDNWKELDHLTETHNYNDLSEQYISRVAKIAERNKARLMRDMLNSERLPALLEKARANELSPEEKEEVRKELINVLKSIPTFSITSLPQRFLTLPILLKILPKTIFTEQPKTK